MLKPLGNVWFCWGGGCAMLYPLVHALVLTHKHIEGVHWFTGFCVHLLIYKG